MKKNTKNSKTSTASKADKVSKNPSSKVTKDELIKQANLYKASAEIAEGDRDYYRDLLIRVGVQIDSSAPLEKLPGLVRGMSIELQNLKLEIHQMNFQNKMKDTLAKEDTSLLGLIRESFRTFRNFLRGERSS